MTASLNLSVTQEGNKVRAAGQASFSPDSQQSIPMSAADQKPGVNIPLMIEAEFYPEDISDFRFSVRAPPKDGLAQAVVNLLKLYMYPTD